MAAFFASSAEDKILYWIDITEPDPESLTDFLSPFRLHPLVLDSCLDVGAGSRVAPFEQSLLVKLPIQTSWDSPDHILLSVICLPQAIITIHGADISALESVAKDFSTAVRFHTLSTSSILYQILDHLIDEDMAFVVKARREIDSLEESIDQEPETVQIEQILALKRKSAHISITCEEQHYCVTTLQTIESDLFDVRELREYFRDSLTHLEYVLRSAGRQQAHLAELHQHFVIIVQDKTNKRLRLLTIISAVFMPLMLIAGIYGMNFKQMPELAWRYGYPAVIILMFTLAGGLLWIFYRKGWLE